MVTIREIAKAVGVSAGTVSRVLNYDPTLSITEVKRKAIIETAEALNYATPRSRHRTRNGGIRLQDRRLTLPHLATVHFLEADEELIDPYYIGVRLGIERRCRAYEAELAKVFHSQLFDEAAMLQGMAGVIAIGKHRDHEVEFLAQNSQCLVFADFVPQDERFDCVYSDLGRATVSILDGLQAAGYRRIAFIGAQDRINSPGELYGEARCRAFVNWQKARGQFDPDMIALSDDCNNGQNLRLEVGFEQARLLLSRDKRPDVILTANDNIAIGTGRAIQEAGLSVPGDIAIASFNDIPVAQFLNPPLSTMNIPGEAIGEAAVDLLVEQINGREYAKRVRIPTEMIWRDSCRRPG
ncbi:LacI family DNA-binding transcriptional regulator [Martelella endophytica]|uniref:LacI family transcriptional regulator n=1 Tax=Martelella endophytica TaxID=1486262 RepID=A0A0D5LLI0_MAREN|nr:LacI family DNA-binding transcriptional regulator [Martelella endophytica]AJY44622.1 LacI family transcriptional regulator [Martelella endophytica]